MLSQCLFWCRASTSAVDVSEQVTVVSVAGDTSTKERVAPVRHGKYDWNAMLPTLETLRHREQLRAKPSNDPRKSYIINVLGREVSCCIFDSFSFRHFLLLLILQTGTSCFGQWSPLVLHSLIVILKCWRIIHRILKWIDDFRCWLYHMLMLVCQIFWSTSFRSLLNFMLKKILYTVRRGRVDLFRFGDWSWVRFK